MRSGSPEDKPSTGKVVRQAVGVKPEVSFATGRADLAGFKALIFLCALAALREIFFLKKDMDRLRSDSNGIRPHPFQQKKRAHRETPNGAAG